jgi:hypothetical protein
VHAVDQAQDSRAEWKRANVPQLLKQPASSFPYLRLPVEHTIYLFKTLFVFSMLQIIVCSPWFRVLRCFNPSRQPASHPV